MQKSRKFVYLVKEKTCFKNTSNRNCVDLFLINNALSYQHTEAGGKVKYELRVNSSNPRVTSSNP